MSRTKGTYTLTSNIEPKVGAPLDARTIVKLKTDLTANNTFEYPYVGLTVFVEEDNKKYTLIGIDPTVTANWREEGSGTTTSADHVTYDNTISELESTNVQDALDEVVDIIGDLPDNDTWRNVKVNGTEKLGTGTDTGAVDFVNGTNTAVTFDSNGNKIKVDVTGLGTAATKNVPSSGNASTTEVVMGNDTRLTDARPASDVSAWAKASTKPTYTASEVGAIATSAKGTANGVAELDANGKVPSAQLPSYVDDVIEVADYSHLPITGETGKIYVTLDDNKTYRWSGSAYVEISESLALGETDSTAYAGNKGKQNADNIATIQGLIPSGATTSNKLATTNDVSSKADKVTSATNGDLAGLDANGNLTDSGVSASSIGNLSGSHLGICETAASTSAKIVTIGDGTWIPKEGDIIGVKFTYTNATLFVTLNVNGTGNKSIWYGDSVDPSGADYICGKADSYIFYMYDGTYWIWLNEGQHDGNNFPSVAVYTASNQQVKIGTCNYYTLTNKSYCHFIFRYSNTYNGELHMQINNSSSAKTIYINGEISSSTNKTLPAGTYIAYYENDKWYFRTDGILPAKTTEGAEINERLDTTTTSASGNPISISGLKSNQLAVDPIITFEPIQDLHGYSNPWPAGGSKNKLPMTVDGIKAASTSGTWSGNKYTYNNVEYTLLVDNANNIIGISVKTLSGGASAASALNIYSISTDAQYILNGCPSGGNTDTYALKIYSYTDSGSGVTIPSGISSKTVYIYVNAGVTIDTIFYPMLRLTTESDATFVPSTNISPINGYDTVEVLSCGKNLVEETIANATIGINGTISISSGTGTIFDMHIARVVQGETYTIKSDEAQSVSQQFVGGFFYSKPALNSVSYNGARLANTSATFISPITGYVAFRTSHGYAAAQCEYGSSQTTFEPYHKATNISEPLPQTVYGGSLDVRTGKLSNTHKAVDMGSLSWTYHTTSTHPFFFTSLSDVSGTATSDNSWCEIYSIVTEYSDKALYWNGTEIRVFDTSYTDATTFTNAVLGKKLVYPLAIPTEIQLTPHEIPLLKDYAYVSTNGTNIAFDYHNGEMASLGDVSQVGETLNLIGEKVQTVFTDTKVTQTATNINTDYEVLFSETADNTTRTEGARKNSNLLFNPSNGVLHGISQVRSVGFAVNQNNGTSGGIALYGNSTDYIKTYGLAFRSTGDSGKHGYVQGDWGIYSYISAGTNRGWVFNNSATTGVASISITGNAVFNGSVTIGGNAANTSGARMEFNSTTKAIDFVFV